jgi:glycosyltransferase involved in cell wall biosynthesis
MHILLNGSFWTQPTVGSGQYLHGLVRHLPRVAPQHRYTLLLPAYQTTKLPTIPGVATITLHTPFDTYHENLAKLWFEQITVPKTARILAQNSNDRCLIHVPYFAPPLFSTQPVITTIPDLIPQRLPQYRGGRLVQRYMALVERAARRATAIITFSRHSRSDISTYLRLPPERITAILLAANERYRPADPQSARRDVAHRYHLSSPYIYYVGGLDVRKNVGVLIQAMEMLRSCNAPPATLAIAGRALGQNRLLFPDLDALIAQHHAETTVQRIEVPDEDGPLLYQASTIFAFPSRYEGFGLPPLEAMACGAPVVCSNASSLPEVVGDAALCVAPDDVGGWAAALGRLLRDEPLQADMRTRGLEQARRFSWERVARETVHVYASL